MKTGDIITPTHAIFKEGKLCVIQLPEEPNFEKFHWKILCDQARLRAIEVQEKDKEKVKELVYWNTKNIKHQRGLMPEDWNPPDLTEYRIEGTRFEIKEEPIYEYSMEETGGGISGFEQVACLIEDDKPQPYSDELLKEWEKDIEYDKPKSKLDHSLYLLKLYLKESTIEEREKVWKEVKKVMSEDDKQ